jgi:hypothetical protein
MQERVKGPAVALIVVGVLGGVLGVIGLVASAMMGTIYKTTGLFNAEQLSQFEQMSASSSVMNIVTGLLCLAGSAFIVYGGLQMMKLRSWPIALIAAILGMIPCFSSCACLFGIPVGIWAIVVLANSEVKQAFQQNSTPT